jgi:hypothetical protein
MRVAPAGATTNPGDVNTVAGTVLSGPAQAVQTGQTPVAVAVDGAGAFAYIADITYHVVRRLELSSGQEQVVAGTGVSGYNGEDIPIRNVRKLLVMLLKMQGFIVFDDYGPRWGEFAGAMGAWVQEGKVKAGQTLTIVHETPTHAIVDGNFGLGGGEAA